MQEHKTSSIEPRNLNPTFVIMAVASLMFRCMWSCGHFSRLWKIAIDFHENALKYNKPILATEQDQRRQSSPPQFRVLCLAVKYYVIMHVRILYRQYRGLLYGSNDKQRRVFWHRLYLIILL